MLALITALSILTSYQQAGASIGQGSVPINSGQNNAYRTNIAFDSLGNAVAVFEQQTGDRYGIFANTYVKDKGWAGPVAIDASPGNAHSGKIAFNGAGDALVVFKKEKGKGFGIYASMRLGEKGWDKPQRIDGGLKVSDGHKAAFDARGNAAAVFEGHDGKAFRIYVNIYDREKGWLGPVKISGSTGNGYFPVTAFDADGNLHVVYFEESPAGLDLSISRYEAKTGRWAPPARLNGNISPATHKEWKQRVKSISSQFDWDTAYGDALREKIPPEQNGWSPTKMDARYRDAYTPSVIARKDGSVSVFFIAGDGQSLRAYTADYRVGAGWGKPGIIDAGGEDVEHIRASMNSKGEIAVVFTQRIEDNLRVHARTFNVKTGWTAPVIIDAGDKTAYNPGVVYTEAGEIIVVWCQWEGVNVKSFANMYKNGSWGVAKRLEKEDGETCGVRIFAGPNGSVIIVYEQEIPAEDDRTINRIFALTGVE